MIPYRLRLQNFLSYRDAVLDFQGLHTACICGANGAGKSSLLEAITWALWGQSRVVVEDDVIHLGAAEAQVDFIFRSQGQLYRVLRRRHRNQAAVLEFQVAHSGQALDKLPSSPLDLTTLDFRSLTAKGVRATQQFIIQTLKLDYETFISSAYLRQGRADEFMLKRPSERKQVLSDLLKLDQYDALADQAKEQARTFRAQALVLEQSLNHSQTQLQRQAQLETELNTLTASLTALQQEQTTDQQHRHALQEQQQQRQQWQQEQQFQQQVWQQLCAQGDRLQQEQAKLTQQHTEHQALIAAADDIQAGYEQWQALQTQETQLLQQAEQHRQLEAQHHDQQRQQEQQRFQLQQQQARLKAQHQSLQQQSDELQTVLAKHSDIEQAFSQLQQARQQLRRLDRLAAQASPLLQHHQSLENRVKQAYTHQASRLETLRAQQQSLQQQQAWLPQFQTEYEATVRQVDYLRGRQSLQEEVLNKGLERRGFLERLKAHLLDYEIQLADLERKRLQIEQIEQVNQTQQHCPQCDRPMDDQHRAYALSQCEQERQALVNLITVMTDQISVSKKEIAILRAEYKAIGRELKGYPGFLQRQGQLRQQLAASVETGQQQQAIAQEIEQLQDSLTQQTYAPELQQELQQLQHTLTELDYDDRNHALARGEVERWRWAQLKQAELRQAQRRQSKLEQQFPKLEAQLQDLDQQLLGLQRETDRLQAQFEQAQKAIAYDPTTHQTLRHKLNQAQTWQLQYQALQQARSQTVHLEQQRQELGQRWAEHQAALQQQQQQAQALQTALEQSPDLGEAIAALNSQIDHRRQRLDGYLAEQGRLEQQQQHLIQLRQQCAEQQQSLKQAQYQQRVHQELAQAFGKNGIQALMIENVLPQLERETNQILSRLSNHQLHVQFITQKAKRKRSGSGKSRTGKNRTDALIDTLDIRIADAKGTRPYETYSGGEAFRVNFSIRLALARLLAQRSGTALQLLIVDEGFGTQDAEGCDRLIAAINAIAPDFARILTITHMPQFKEAFQARIEVSKTEAGSTLAIAV